MNLFDFGDDAKYRDDTPEELVLLLDEFLTTPDNKPQVPYDVMGSSIGSEFELADIDRNRTLPEEFSWDGKDQTVMNSNGVATDPSLKEEVRTWQFGGELNTIPFNTISAAVSAYKNLLELNPEATVNNSCNLHTHFRVPGLDLNGLKRVIAYYYVHRTELIAVSDYIPTPQQQGFDFINITNEDQALITKRYKHHINAHKGTRHSDLPEFTVINKLKAQTLEAFHHASVVTKSGTDVLDSNAVRAAINTWQMRLSRKKEHEHLVYEDRPFAESGTIEFRSHHGTTDIKKYENVLIWDINILNAALNTGDSPQEVFDKLFPDKTQEDVFPEYIPMDVSLYKIFKDTKNDDSMKRRIEVQAVIKNLKDKGVI